MTNDDILGRAPAPGSRRLPSIDGMRALCIIGVLGAHASRGAPGAGWLDYFFNGGLGVRVFFVISGFLIGSLLLRERQATGSVGLGNFYLRRVVRLFPAYFAFLGALLVLDAATRLDLSACNYFTSLTFTRNYACSAWVDGHLWSLSVEEQFYLLIAPLAALLPVRALLAVAVGCLVVAPLDRVVYNFTSWPALQYNGLLQNADALAAGVILAFLVVMRRDVLTAALRWRPRAMRITAALTIYVVWVCQTAGFLGIVAIPLGPTVSALAAAYLIASFAFVPFGPVFRFLNTRPMIFLGLISYSVYLWQQPFFSPPGYFAEGDGVVLSFPVNVLLALGTGALSYALFERPFLRLRDRLRRGSPALATGTEGAASAQMGSGR